MFEAKAKLLLLRSRLAPTAAAVQADVLQLQLQCQRSAVQLLDEVLLQQ